MKQSNSVTSTTVKETLYASEKVECTKEEYHRDVRGGILDFTDRQIDLGNVKLAQHCIDQTKRLDKKHGIPREHVDQRREIPSI